MQSLISPKNRRTLPGEGQEVDIPIEERPVFMPCTNKSTNPMLKKIDINRKIHSYLKSKKMPTNLGYIYIFESPKYAPSHVKIGRTENDPNERLQSWRRKCGLPLTKVESKDLNAFDHHGIVGLSASLVPLFKSRYILVPTKKNPFEEP